MSENKAGFNPMNNEGSAPKVEAYKWGFNFKSVKGANTDMTYGWKASGVFGLATSVYVSPVAMAPAAAAAGGAGAIIGASAGAKSNNAASGAGIGFAVGVAAAAAPFVLGGVGNMIFSTELAYKTLMKMSNTTFMISPVNVTNIGLRPDYLMRAPAYMTVEVGAKKDFIFGNKYDYCTGTVNKTVNGETVRCHADKVEWYYANLYKYIEGTETKMESSKLLQPGAVSVPVGGKSNLTQVEVLKDKSKYAETYKQHGDYLKAVATKDATTKAQGDIAQTAGGKYSIGAKDVSILPTGDFEMMAVGKSVFSGGTGVTIGCSAGNVTLKSGTNSVKISAAETKLNNKLSLGMPGVEAVTDVSAALAAYAKAQADAAAELAETQLALTEAVVAMVEKGIMG